MAVETTPAWAQDAPVPTWAQDTPATVPAVKAAPSGDLAAAQGDRDEEARSILYLEFPKAQQALNDATATGDAASIARAKEDLASLVREITAKKGAAPSVNIPASGPARMAISGDTTGATILPDSDIGKRIAYGSIGAGGATALTALPIAKVRASMMAKALKNKDLADTQAASEAQASAKAAAAADAQATAAAAAQRAAYEADVTKAGKAYNDFMGAKEAGPTPTRGGSKGWLGGRMSPEMMAQMPNSLLEGITTLTGQGPGSASNAEAQHTANMQRAIELGYDPRYSKLVNGIAVPYTQEELAARAKNISDIQEAQRLADAQKQASIATKGRFAANILNQANTPVTPPAPVTTTAPSTLDSVLGTLKGYGNKALEATGKFAKNPHAAIGSTAFGVGAMAPDIQQSLYGRDYGQAGLDALKGGMLGYGATFLPQLVQRGLVPIGSLFSSAGNLSNAADRANYDPTGAAISGIGGLASLAPLAPLAIGAGPPGLAALGIGAVGATLPGIINAIRDRNEGRHIYREPRLERAAREGANPVEQMPQYPAISGRSRMAQ